MGDPPLPSPSPGPLPSPSPGTPALPSWGPLPSPSSLSALWPHPDFSSVPPSSLDVDSHYFTAGDSVVAPSGNPTSLSCPGVLPCYYTAWSPCTVGPLGQRFHSLRPLLVEPRQSQHWGATTKPDPHLPVASSEALAGTGRLAPARPWVKGQFTSPTLPGTQHPVRS